ncbi:MAG: hypothetical protein A4E30_01669 [Methanomassiliicoccales archaeon PtaB.Bin215]|nr:MAG: hypothetical protein A4E30_01669 [Methanomassiliicoccales archaeon PtaB.Bin215]
MTEKASEDTVASMSALVPSENSSLSMTPAGPEMKTVQAFETISENLATVSLPMSKMGRSEGSALNGTSFLIPPSSRATSTGVSMRSP